MQSQSSKFFIQSTLTSIDDGNSNSSSSKTTRIDNLSFPSSAPGDMQGPSRLSHPTSAIRPLPPIPTSSSRVHRPLPPPPLQTRSLNVRPLPVPAAKPDEHQRPVQGEPGPSRWGLHFETLLESNQPTAIERAHENDAFSEQSEETEDSEEEPKTDDDDPTLGPMEIVLYGPSNGFGAMHFETHSYRQEWLKVEDQYPAADLDDLVFSKMSVATPSPSPSPRRDSFEFDQENEYHADRSPIWPEDTRPRRSIMKGIFTRKWVLEKKGKRYVEEDYQKIIGALRRL